MNSYKFGNVINAKALFLRPKLPSLLPVIRGIYMRWTCCYFRLYPLKGVLPRSLKGVFQKPFFTYHNGLVKLPDLRNDSLELDLDTGEPAEL